MLNTSRCNVMYWNNNTGSIEKLLCAQIRLTLQRTLKLEKLIASVLLSLTECLRTLVPFKTSSMLGLVELLALKEGFFCCWSTSLTSRTTIKRVYINNAAEMPIMHDLQ